MNDLRASVSAGSSNINTSRRIPLNNSATMSTQGLDINSSPKNATPSQIRNRLAKGFGATALSPLVTAVIQLGTVPALLHAWGGARYGDWIILYAIPGYLTFSDLGFGNVSASDMTVRVASGDRRGALQTFQSSWALLTAVSVMGIVLTALAACRIPWGTWLRFSSITNSQAAAAIVTLGAYAALTQQTSILESGLRCEGNFASGVLWGTLLRLGETMVATLVALSGGNFFHVALAYLLARLLGTMAYGRILFIKSPWLSLGLNHANWRTIRVLAAPAMGFVVFPLSQALSLQGFTLMIGTLEGSLAVASFSTIRTLTRFSFQIINSVARTLWPELSSAFGSGNIALARNLHRRACQASLALSILSAAGLWLVGPALYHDWIHGRIGFDTHCFHVLIIVSTAGAFWYTSSIVPMSNNSHHKIALTYFFVSTVAFVLAWPLTQHFHLVGAAYSLLAAELAMSLVTTRVALRRVNDSLTSFLQSLLTLPKTATFAQEHPK